MTSPTLTTVDQSIEETLSTAVEILFVQLGKPPRAKPIVRTIMPELIMGQSTGPVR